VTGHKQTTDGTDYTTSYTYTLGGALDEETYPSGRVVKNIIDSNGDLAMVKGKKNALSGYWNYAQNFTYAPNGAVTSMQLGNGRWESTQFNSRLQPTQIALGSTISATDLLKLDYGYGTTDNNGNVQTQTITVPTIGLNTGFAAVQTYSYDSLNRLKDATEDVTPTGGSASQSWKQTFTYDRYGNKNFDEANTTTLLKSCGTSPNFTVCAADRKIVNPSINTSNNRLSTSDNYTFDNSGNTTADANGQTYTYDGENKMVKASNSSGTLGEYVFDGDGKRVKKYVPSTGELTIFVYDASGKSIAEYSTIVANSTDAKVNYLTSDHLGSPRINTDQIGSVISRHDYHPFGEEIYGLGGRTTGLNYGDDSVRKQFTGYERDGETGLDFAKNRTFTSSGGRFLSPDPLLSSGRRSDPKSWNRYAYVHDNPLNFVDPSGLYEYVAGTSDDDKKRLNKAYDKLVKARDHYEKGSKKYDAINKSLTALGAPGEKNGVMVYVDNSQSNPGITNGNPQMGADDKATGKADVFIGINLSKFKENERGLNDLTGAFGHEGRHAADFQSESRRVAGLTYDGINALSQEGKIMSHAISEVNAYRVSSYIAEAISSSDTLSLSVSQYEIWNRGWAAVDENKKRDAGIRGALEAPWGSYKFKFTSNPFPMNMPLLDNQIDNANQWTQNGGPLF